MFTSCYLPPIHCLSTRLLAMPAVCKLFPSLPALVLMLPLLGTCSGQTVTPRIASVRAPYKVALQFGSASQMFTAPHSPLISPFPMSLLDPNILYHILSCIICDVSLILGHYLRQGPVPVLFTDTKEHPNRV